MDNEINTDENCEDEQEIYDIEINQSKNNALDTTGTDENTEEDDMRKIANPDNYEIDYESDSTPKKHNLKLGIIILFVSLIITLAVSIPLLTKNKDTAESQNKKKNTEEVEEEPYVLRIETAVNLPLFSPAVLDGYSSCSDLENDIIEAGKYMIKYEIQKNKKIGITHEPVWLFDIPASPMMESAATDTTFQSKSSDTKSGEDSYETNNQVEGVDEADIVKSDGEFVYVVYGNDIVIITLEGDILYRTTIPNIESEIPRANYWNYEGPYYVGYDAMPSFFAISQKIESMLLYEDRLVVLASSYFYGNSHPKVIGSDMTATFVYYIDKLNGALNLVESTAIRGNFQNARSIESSAYVVTNTFIDSYRLSSPFDRYLKKYWNMTDEEYVFTAEEEAQDLLPKFAKQLMTEMFGDKNLNGTVDDNSCRNIVKLSLMQTKNEEENGTDPTSGAGILNSFAQVLSFDMQATLFYQRAGISGAFLPSSYSIDLYSDDEMLILAGRGWSYTRNSSWREFTYLIGFEYRNGIAIPSATAAIPGYLMNQFSMDFYKDHLRVATTTSASWGIINETANEWGETSPSENYVIILKKSGKVFEEISKLSDLGVTEQVYAVRFMGDKGYVVTFRMIDPLYTLDLSDPMNPKAAGELKITGFSNYLHPIDKDHLIGVGQDADENTGQQLGLQISLFDVSDLSNPVLKHKHVVEGWSRSSSQHDHHSFRYLPKTKALILPVSTYDEKTTFDGFYIYDINEKGITKLGEVVHVDNDFILSFRCFSSAYLQPRSLVFNSNLMTLKGHTIMMSENVSSPSRSWLINLDNGYDKSCNPWFPL